MNPRITLALVAYRQSAFIDAAVRSALAQVCEPIEILLSDDASPDDTHTRMLALAAQYKGPHQVVVRRNPRNLGIGAHYNEVMQAARGELVVLMAGDDISLPQRVARNAQAWDDSGGRADLIASDVVDMTYDGVDQGITKVDDLAQWATVQDWATRRPYIIGAAHAVTRRLFDQFGPVAVDVTHEDQVDTLRAICRGGALTVAEPLLRYRRGGISGGLQQFTAAEFVSRGKRQNDTHVALHRQWLVDARLAGCLDLVDRATRREHDRELFIQALLRAPDLAARLRVATGTQGVDLSWRLRKLIYWQWPVVAVSVRRLQVRSKQLRRG